MLGHLNYYITFDPSRDTVQHYDCMDQGLNVVCLVEMCLKEQINAGRQACLLVMHTIPEPCTRVAACTGLAQPSSI
jgi:hypothetical protein